MRSADSLSHTEIEAITYEWERALAAHDVDALLACYAPDATLESPLIPHVLGTEGVCRGHEQLRSFLTEVLRRTPVARHYHRGAFFTDGRQVIFEYPRSGPDGEQMDFVEVMEIEHGVIRAHRVYWGWRGVGILANDQYYRDNRPDIDR
ncbi:nuclear transport factor 2 family protein [Nocardia sp. NPDC051030]|uniref:nuclear transport factor 2 family protein n=1 Tax=Nocardia sp. NPDC051030 TaxID=3155162 RepID=UPI003438AEB1